MNKNQIQGIITAIGIILFMTSCEQKRDTKENFGKYSLDLLQTENSAQGIYLMPQDSVLTKDTLLIDWMRSLKDSTKYAEYLDKQESQVKDWRKKAIDLDLKNRQ